MNQPKLQIISTKPLTKCTVLLKKNILLRAMGTQDVVEGIYDKEFYPLSTLEKSAIPFIIPFHKGRNTKQVSFN